MKNKRFITSLLLLCILFTHTLILAQGLINIQHYSTENGLSQNIVQGFVQDDEGYIWISTHNGLEMFDGYTFQNYKSYPTDKMKLRYNRLTKLVKGGAHCLWCKTYDQQVFLFDTQRKVFEDVFSFHPKIEKCINAQDMIALKNNILWIVGNNGKLWRCDENKYRQEGGLMYLPEHSIPQHGNQILHIELDPYNNEWIFTEKGYFVNGKEKLCGNIPFQFFTTVEKVLYMASPEKGIFFYTPDKGIQPLFSPYDLTNLQGIYSLQNGLLGIATNQQFITYNPSNQQFCQLFSFPKGKEFYPLTFLQDQNETIWILNGLQNVIRYDTKKKKTETLHYDINDHLKNRAFIHEDSYGQIWLLPANGKLSCYSPLKNCFETAYTYNKKGEKEYYDPSFNKMGAISYLFDKQKNFWQCREKGFDKISFSNNSYHYIPSVRNAGVRSLFIDSAQRLWVGNKNGNVEIYDNKQNYCGSLSASGRIIKDRKTVMGPRIYCFFEDSKHRIWMGSREDGLYIAEPNGDGYKLFQYTQHSNDVFSINANSIYSICEDKQGHIWVGTYGGGINLVEGTFPELRFRHIGNCFKNAPSKQEYLKIRSLHCTTDGIMMAGSTEGLITFSSNFQSPDDIRFYCNHSEANAANSLANNDVLYIFENHLGKIYVITYSGGVSQLTSKELLSNHLTFEHLNKRNGLPSDIAYAIWEEDENNLWISFETCLCRYKQKEGTFETYNLFNHNLHLLIEEVPPIITMKQIMYIGTDQGLVYIDLNKLQKSDFAPPIVFTKVKIQKKDNKSKLIPVIRNSLTLAEDERNITISFSALDFTNVENLQYAYRLKGISDEWVYIDGNHSASFVNLPTGNFVLEVKSTNGDGVWTNNITELSMDILPTFWETGWALVIYIVGTILMILIVSGILVYIFNLKRKVNFEQQLTNLKLRFFTDISHDLRTPLTLITAPVEEVLEQEKLSKKGHENMVTAKRNIDHMLRLINQLLDFRKIQNNKMKLYIEQTDVIALFRRTFNNFISLAEQKNIDFRFISALESSVIYTDIDKLEKILFNLLSNAFKYTPNGKSIQLIIEIRESCLEFKIKDEGRGFDIHKIDLLFNRFETLGKQTNSNSSGIGLSLVNELVHLIHGTIKADSILGQGSQFTVSIPIHYNAFTEDKNAELILNDGNKEETKEHIESSQDNSDKELSVLIVEDNEELRHFIVSILQETYQVIEASNGMEGLDKIKSTLPDLVISDIMMPLMDGIELLDKTRKDHDVSHIPFILLSAKSTLEDRINGLEYGADDYITKPFSGGYLKTRISSLLKQRKNLKEYFTDMQSAGSESKSSSSKDSLNNHFPSAPSITHFDELFIKKIAQSVEEQLGNQDFRIEDLAETVNLSRAVFYRKIKSILGVPPKDFVRDMRVKKAIHLLDTGEYSVSEIAYMSGFSSPQYFSRVFKEVMNCTPSEYKINEEKKY